MKVTQSSRKKYKYIAAVIIIAVLTGVFLPLSGVSAEPDDNGGPVQSDPSYQSGQDEERTQIKSVIPYVAKTENGVEQTVPIESREDMTLYPNSVSLKMQIYVNAEDSQKYYGSTIYIFKLRPHEEITDIAYAQPAGSFDVKSPEGFSYPFSLLSDLSNFRNGEIFNKFVVGVREGDKFIPMPGTDAKYISNINYLSNKKDTPPVSKTKKGLSIQLIGEARMLGVGYTTVNMFLNDFMAAGEGANTEVYKYGDKDYYFNIDKIAEYDKKIKYLTNEGINVTAVLLIKSEGFVPSNLHSQSDDNENPDAGDSPYSLVPVDPLEYLIHPNALLSVQGGGGNPYFYGINTTDENGVKCFEALMSFIADRYVRKDDGYGRIYNIILGCQIGRASFLNYCGKTDLVTYVKDYIRALRICDTAMRSRFGGSRVYASFDNSFAAAAEDGNFINKEIIDRLCDYSKKEGNFIWNVAFQAYNADRSYPECWKETLPANDFDTPVITMKNIEILCNYINLEKQDYLPSGEIRKVMLLDQGFSSGDNSKEGQELQAAAFVYAYLKAKYIPDITAFIYHGHVDSKLENEIIGSSFWPGLWTNVPGTENEPGEKKKIYDVFKYMDTNKESEKIDFAKAILGIEDFTEIARLYAKETEPAIILKEVAAEPLKTTLNATNIGIFNDARLSGFIGTSNISKMSRVSYDNKDSEEFHGKSMLFAGFSAPVKGDFGGVFKIYAPEDPVLNLKDEKYVGVKLRIDTALDMPEDQKIQLILIMESEAPTQNTGTVGETGGAITGPVQNTGVAAKTISVFEGLANISPNKDEIIYFDISSWADRTDIKKIKLLVNPYADYSGTAAQSGGEDPAEPGASDYSENSGAAEKYDFNLYVLSIVSAHNSRMSGFTTFLIIFFILIFVIVAGYGALYIRARIIKKKRREMRENQRRRAMAAAARARGIPPNRLPPGNNNSKKR